ncbi:hypothetical protein CSUI_010347, partial [Cystoisospora suis]
KAYSLFMSSCTYVFRYVRTCCYTSVCVQRLRYTFPWIQVCEGMICK